MARSLLSRLWPAAGALVYAAHSLPSSVLASGGGSDACSGVEESNATPDFGSQVSSLSFFLYITIFLSLGIQWVRNFLHRKTVNYPHIREVLEAAYEELSSVGVTSFLLFLLETSTLPQLVATAVQAGSAHEYTAVFHEVHMALFFIVFLFLLTVIVVQLYTKTISRWWYIYEQRTLADNIVDFNAVHALRLASKYPAWLFDLLNHNRVVEVNDALTFTLIKARFFTAYAGKGGIPREFSFARYLHLSLNEISVECVRLHWSIWLFTLVAIGINWIRYKVVPVSSGGGSIILMVTGLVSVCLFLFLFWQGRSIRRKLLDERHFLDPRFTRKLAKIAEIRPVSLYEDYQHHEADFTRVLSFTKLQVKHQEEDEWRKQQQQRQEKMREHVVLAVADAAHAEHQANEATAAAAGEDTPLKNPQVPTAADPSPPVDSSPADIGRLTSVQPAPTGSRRPTSPISRSSLGRVSKQIFTEQRLGLVRQGSGLGIGSARPETSVGVGSMRHESSRHMAAPMSIKHGSITGNGAVGDEVSRVGVGPSFMSAVSAVTRGLPANPLSPARDARPGGQRFSISGTGSVLISHHRPLPSSLSHLVSHRMRMVHPQQKKPAADSIYAQGGEAATGHGLDPKLHPTAAARRDSRRPSVEVSRRRSATSRQRSVLSKQQSSILTQGPTAVTMGTAVGKAALKDAATEWKKVHADQLKEQSKDADQSMRETSQMEMAVRHHARDGAEMVAERNAHIYDHTMLASGEIVSPAPTATQPPTTHAADMPAGSNHDGHRLSSSFPPIGHHHHSHARDGSNGGIGHIDIAAHPRHIPEGDELHDADGLLEEQDLEGEASDGGLGADENSSSAGDGSSSEEEYDDVEYMRALHTKQLAMQEFIHDMHEQAVRDTKLHCCVTCVPPAGSKSKLEEAFILSDPNINLRLFQIVMLFQSTYMLASCYYFYTLSGNSQVTYLVFTFLPMLAVLLVFVPKFLRNHTVTTSVHSQIRLEVVSDMMEAEELQQEHHHMNSLHVRLQARAISLSEVPIASFAGEYKGRDEPFAPAGPEDRRLPVDWQAQATQRKKEKEAAAAAAVAATAAAIAQAGTTNQPLDKLDSTTTVVQPPPAAPTAPATSVAEQVPSQGQDGERASGAGVTSLAAAPIPEQLAAVPTPQLHVSLLASPIGQSTGTGLTPLMPADVGSSSFAQAAAAPTAMPPALPGTPEVST